MQDSVVLLDRFSVSLCNSLSLCHSSLLARFLQSFALEIFVFGEEGWRIDEIAWCLDGKAWCLTSLSFSTSAVPLILLYDTTYSWDYHCPNHRKDKLLPKWWRTTNNRYLLSLHQPYLFFSQNTSLRPYHTILLLCCESIRTSPNTWQIDMIALKHSYFDSPNPKLFYPETKILRQKYFTL